MKAVEPRPRALLVLLAAAALLVTAGVAWSVANLGPIPHYGDTIEYLRLSRTRRVDAFRGPLYPALLHVADWLDSEAPFPAWMRWERPRQAGRVPCVAPASLVRVQILQLLIGIGAMAVFVRIFGGTARLAPRLRPLAVRASTLALVGVLAFDPLVAHFQLSVMTDGLSLSACLTACAALYAVALGQRRRTAWAVVLFATVLAASTLRPEKGWVLLGTAVTSAVVWGLGGHGRRRELLLAVALSAAAFGCALAIQLGLRADHGRWDLRTTVLHHRIVFPHLASIRPGLSDEARSVISEDDARLYDSAIHYTWTVINKATWNDPERRRALTNELAAAALRQHAPGIVADAAADTVEHAIATPSWYARLVGWALRGAPISAHRGGAEMTPRTYAVLSAHWPRASLWFVSFAGAAFLLASCAAVVAFVRRPAWLRELLFPRWVPILAFALGNAAVFSFTADLVHIRYAILSHVACLLLVYRGALEWAAGTSDRS